MRVALYSLYLVFRQTVLPQIEVIKTVSVEQIHAIKKFVSSTRLGQAHVIKIQLRSVKNLDTILILTKFLTAVALE